MLSQVTLVPERGLGLVILTNTEGHNSVFSAVARRILDAYLGAPVRDWSTIMLTKARRQDALQDSAARQLEISRPNGTHPSVPAERLAGPHSP